MARSFQQIFVGFQGDRSRTRSQSSDTRNTLVEALSGLTLDDEDIDDTEDFNDLIRYHVAEDDGNYDDDDDENGTLAYPLAYSDDDDEEYD